MNNRPTIGTAATNVNTEHGDGRPNPNTLGNLLALDRFDNLRSGSSSQNLSSGPQFGNLFITLLVYFSFLLPHQETPLGHIPYHLLVNCSRKAGHSR